MEGDGLCQQRPHYFSGALGHGFQEEVRLPRAMRVRVTISGCLSANQNSSLARLHLIYGEACLLGLVPHKFIIRVTLDL